MKIEEVPANDPRLWRLISRHKEFAVANTPVGSGCALTPQQVAASSIRYWLALRGGAAVGCVGMELISEDHAEIKSLHVLPDQRGQGIGIDLMNNVVDQAQRAGMTRISLETGRSEGFASSRRLYRRLGFRRCEAFGDYEDDPFSYCMTMPLPAPDGRGHG